MIDLAPTPTPSGIAKMKALYLNRFAMELTDEHMYAFARQPCRCIDPSRRTPSRVYDLQLDSFPRRPISRVEQLRRELHPGHELLASRYNPRFR